MLVSESPPDQDPTALDGRALTRSGKSVRKSRRKSSRTSCAHFTLCFTRGRCAPVGQAYSYRKEEDGYEMKPLKPR
jgi:hypothetical protein